jgi:hypothetical protein
MFFVSTDIFSLNGELMLIFLFVEVDSWRVDVAESILLKPRRDIFKVSGVRISSKSNKILESQKVLILAVEVL